METDKYSVVDVGNFQKTNQTCGCIEKGIRERTQVK